MRTDDIAAGWTEDPELLREHTAYINNIKTQPYYGVMAYSRKTKNFGFKLVTRYLETKGKKKNTIIEKKSICQNTYDKKYLIDFIKTNIPPLELIRSNPFYKEADVMSNNTYKNNIESIFETNIIICNIIKNYLHSVNLIVFE